MRKKLKTQKHYSIPSLISWMLSEEGAKTAWLIATVQLAAIAVILITFEIIIK